MTDALDHARAHGITGECPWCGRKLRPIPMYDVATTIVTRACRSKECGARWQVKVTPIVSRPGLLAMHELSFVEIISDEQKQQLTELRASLERITT